MIVEVTKKLVPVKLIIRSVSQIYLSRIFEKRQLAFDSISCVPPSISCFVPEIFLMFFVLFLVINFMVKWWIKKFSMISFILLL